MFGDFWSALIHEHEAALLDFLRARLGSSADAQDVLQDTFLRLCSVDPSVVKFARSFIFKISANLAIDRLRSRRIEASAAASLHTLASCERTNGTSNSLAQPDRALLNDQDLAITAAAIADLPDECRRVLLLHRLEGMSYRQIARELGISKRMVEKNIAEAIEHCRARLDAVRAAGKPLRESAAPTEDLRPLNWRVVKVR